MTDQELRSQQRLKQLRGYLRQPGFKGVTLSRQEIEDLLRLFDNGFKVDLAKWSPEI